MNPRLFELKTVIEGMGSIHLPAYFTMLTIGFIFAIFLARRWGGEHGLSRKRMVDFGIWMALWGVVGSRILHVIADGHFWDYVHLITDPTLVTWDVDPSECKALGGVWDAARGICHPVKAEGSARFAQIFSFANVFGGGFAYYGGFIGAALFSIYYIRKHNWPAGKICDMAGWAISLGLVWGRMGCFLASCCFGSRTSCSLAVAFPPGSSASRHHWKEGLLESYRLESLAVHPTQLYEAAAALLIAGFAYFVVRPRKRFDGQVFVVAMIMYAVARFLVEFIRRDERGGLFGLSTSQLVAIGVVVVCVGLHFIFRRNAARKSVFSKQ